MHCHLTHSLWRVNVKCLVHDGLYRRQSQFIRFLRGVWFIKLALLRFVKYNETYDNTGLKKKYFASKFKSTLHNLAANSITSQMELERTTHAKLFKTKQILQIHFYIMMKIMPNSMLLVFCILHYTTSRFFLDMYRYISSFIILYGHRITLKWYTFKR